MTQQRRLLVATVYGGWLVALSLAAFGTLLPPFGITGAWFYSGFAALLLGEYLVEPHFSRPADAMANGVALIIAVVTADLSGAVISQDALATGRALLTAYGVSIVAAAALAILSKDSMGAWHQAGKWASQVVRAVGRAKWVFSIAFVASAYAAFRDQPDTLTVLLVSWFVIAAMQPIDWIVRHSPRPPRMRARNARVLATDDPNIVVVEAGASIPLGARVDIDGKAAGTVVDTTALAERPVLRVALDTPTSLHVGDELSLLHNDDADESVVGAVDAGTDLDSLRIRTIPQAARRGLSEGRILSAAISDATALYQIVRAEVANRGEEGLGRQLVYVEAQKLGRWNTESTAFEPVDWIPDPGAVVRQIARQTAAHDPAAFVGRVPDTRYGVAADPALLVTHNTAVLGILGSGKTHLAWELIWRMMAAGIKVVVLDITGRYAPHFSEVADPDTERQIASRINAAIAGQRGNLRIVDNDDAGNVVALKAKLKGLVRWFVRSDARLLVVNPNAFSATRMDGFQRGGEAQALTDVTMVEVTRFVSEYLLEELQADERIAGDGEARVCLVLEEAHSLVPEWNSATNDSDRRAVNGTARAVLQGRKYGFGTLLVTQRTANVTKSILNQCNTVFRPPSV